MEHVATAQIPDRDRILSMLRDQKGRLARFGILHIDLVGSVARGDAEEQSDVDLAITFGGPDRRCGFDQIALLSDLTADLAALLGRPVDVISIPVQRPALAAAIERDAVRAF